MCIDRLVQLTMRLFQHFINVSKERDEFVEKIRWYTSENERLQKTTEKLQRGRLQFCSFWAHAPVHVGFSRTFFELKLGLIVVCDCIVCNACIKQCLDTHAHTRRHTHTCSRRHTHTHARTHARTHAHARTRTHNTTQHTHTHTHTDKLTSATEGVILIEPGLTHTDAGHLGGTDSVLDALVVIRTPFSHRSPLSTRAVLLVEILL